MGGPMRTVTPGQCKTVDISIYMTALVCRRTHHIHTVNNTIAIQIIQSTVICA